MARNGTVVVPQRVIDVLGPRLARSSRPTRNPGAVMAEELFRDDEVRPVLLKALRGAPPTAAELNALKSIPLASGTWEQVVDLLQREEV